jgi:hypothetical protein
MIVLSFECQRPPSIAHGLGNIAQKQRVAGMVHRDRARKTAKFCFVDDDHPGAWLDISTPRGRRRGLPFKLQLVAITDDGEQLSVDELGLGVAMDTAVKMAANGRRASPDWPFSCRGGTRVGHDELLAKSARGSSGQGALGV